MTHKSLRYLRKLDEIRIVWSKLCENEAKIYVWIQFFFIIMKITFKVKKITKIYDFYKKLIVLGFIKNVKSSTSHKKNSETVRLRDFNFYLYSTFVYE